MHLCFFADDAVLLASSGFDLQQIPAACEATGIRVSTSKSEAIGLWKTVDCPLQVGRGIGSRISRSCTQVVPGHSDAGIVAWFCGEERGEFGKRSQVKWESN